MLSEGTMGVGIVAVILVVLVRSGLLQLLIDWLRSRAGGARVNDDSPPPSPPARDLSLPELLRERCKRRAEFDAEEQLIRDILEGKEKGQ